MQKDSVKRELGGVISPGSDQGGVSLQVDMLANETADSPRVITLCPGHANDNRAGYWVHDSVNCRLQSAVSKGVLATVPTVDSVQVRLQWLRW